MFTSDSKQKALVENLRTAREARAQEKVTKHAAEVIKVRPSLRFVGVRSEFPLTTLPSCGSCAPSYCAEDAEAPCRAAESDPVIEVNTCTL